MNSMSNNFPDKNMEEGEYVKTQSVGACDFIALHTIKRVHFRSW